MLRTGLIHPEILDALGRAGHGSLVLLSDGNFPHDTAPYRGAPRVYLNLRPGLISVIDALQALVTAIPIESAAVMVPPDGQTPPVHQEFADILGDTPMTQLDRQGFYDATADTNLALVIATGEQRIYANLLLTIGVIRADD
ncbi:MAG: RbsD/FucU family protein [Actinomycetota bacterium]